MTTNDDKTTDIYYQGEKVSIPYPGLDANSLAIIYWMYIDEEFNGEHVPAQDKKLLADLVNRLINEFKEPANFGWQCYQDRCEGALVEASVVKKLEKDKTALAQAVVAMAEGLKIPSVKLKNYEGKILNEYETGAVAALDFCEYEAEQTLTDNQAAIQLAEEILKR